MIHALTASGPAVPLFLGAPALEPVRPAGHEGVNSLFEYELLPELSEGLGVDASHAADFNLNDFLGLEITCAMQVDGAGQFLAGASGGASEGCDTQNRHQHYGLDAQGSAA